MKRRIRAVIVVSALFGAACSKEGEPGSCHRPHDNACIDYDRAQGAAGKRLCAGLQWTPGEKSCPSADRIGSCAKKSGAEWVYGGPPNNYNASSAKTACEWAGGTFTPLP